MKLNSPSVCPSICTCLHASIHSTGIYLPAALSNFGGGNDGKKTGLGLPQGEYFLVWPTKLQNGGECYETEESADPAPAGRVFLEDLEWGSWALRTEEELGGLKEQHAQSPRGGRSVEPSVTVILHLFHLAGLALRISEKLWTLFWSKSTHWGTCSQSFTSNSGGT